MAENRWTVVFAVGAAALAGTAAGVLAGLRWTRKPDVQAHRAGSGTGDICSGTEAHAKDNGVPAETQRGPRESPAKRVSWGEEEETEPERNFRQSRKWNGGVSSDESDICADEIQEGIENLLRYAAGKVKGVEIGF